MGKQNSINISNFMENNFNEIAYEIYTGPIPVYELVNTRNVDGSITISKKPANGFEFVTMRIDRLESGEYYTDFTQLVDSVDGVRQPLQIVSINSHSGMAANLDINRWVTITAMKRCVDE